MASQSLVKPSTKDTSDEKLSNISKVWNYSLARSPLRRPHKSECNPNQQYHDYLGLRSKFSCTQSNLPNYYDPLKEHEIRSAFAKTTSIRYPPVYPQARSRGALEIF